MYLKNELVELTDFLYAGTHSRKLKGDWKILGLAWSKWVLPVWCQDSKFDCISKMNRWNKLIFLHAGTNSGKLKVDSKIYGWVWSKMVMTF